MQDFNLKDNLKLNLCILLITSWVRITYGQCQERSKHHAEIIHGQRYSEGELLTCKANIGLNLCIEACAKVGGCQFVNYDSNKLFCELMEYIDGNKTSNVQIQHGEVLVLMSNTSALCDSNVCRSGYIRLQTSSGRNTSVPIDRKCCEEKFLVTGPHGVDADMVTFSSVNSQDVYLHSRYSLDSASGWVADNLVAEQWIQVLFQSRKIVVGVVTQGRSEYSQWVRSYQVKYKDLSGTWKYFKDKAGVVATFPGNSDRYTKKTNYFPRPFSTTGVQLRPKTWTDWISLRFDILGC